MCGRYWIKRNAKFNRRFPETAAIPNLESSYNVCPGTDQPVIRQREDEREAQLMTWGFVANWADSDSSCPINARGETLATRPTFKRSFQSKRCVVPASGFFEWRETPQGKLPYAIRPADGEPLALAGLWDVWERPDGSLRRSFAVVTTSPNELVSALHDRMPVILDPRDEELWLSPEAEGADLQHLLNAVPAEELVMHPVSRDINSPDNDYPELLEPVEEQQLRLL